VVFGLLTIAVLGFFAVQPNRSSYEGLSLGGSLDDKASRQVLNNIIKKDSDNDGLKDWEEELWGTDPNNEDTDGDGTKDGEEVDADRNPLKAGPGDVLDVNLTKESYNNSISQNTKLTTTDKFAQSFFQDYLSLKESGVLIDENSKNALIESAVSSAFDSEAYLREYESSDLNLLEDVGEVVTRDYGNTLGYIIFKNLVETESEMDILNSSLSNNNPEEIKKLSSSVSGYKNISKESLSMLVPKDATKIHIDLIESADYIAKNIEDISVLYEDPVRAIAGISEYEQNITLFKKILQDFESYFVDKRISFGDDEAGSVFFNTI
jgi:hypothetical protein